MSDQTDADRRRRKAEVDMRWARENIERRREINNEWYRRHAESFNVRRREERRKAGRA